MTGTEPKQITGSQKLQGPEVQDPLGRHDQSEAKDQGEGEAQVEGLALTGRIVEAPGDGSQGNGIVG